MYELVPLNNSHTRRLYQISVGNELLTRGMTYDEYASVLMAREGWVVVDTDTNTVAGSITLSNFRPLHSVVIHVTFDTSHHGRWCSRRLLQLVYGYIFNVLSCVKCYALAVVGHTYAAAKLLTDIGYSVMGVDTYGMRVWSDLYDIVHYQMGVGDCIWSKRPLPTYIRTGRITNPYPTVILDLEDTHALAA